jgi:5-methyltetrahydrofolate--homocysteine methyltransferase
VASKFRAALASGRIIFFDGAMGTMLSAREEERGAIAGVTAKAWTVPAIQRAYRAAGADVLITNTFDVNRQMLGADFGAQTALKLACQKAYLDALEAADQDGLVASEKGFVAGDMGPSGALLEPYGTTSEATVFDAFHQTARLLGESGVDLFIVETMTDAREMKLAVEACREAARYAELDIPVAASMAFDPSRRGGFRTNMGVSPTEATSAMVAAGADVIGANCGSVTPEQMAEIVGEFRRATPLPILAQPNAGVPELRAGRTVFRLAPEAWAAGMLKVRDAGAQLLGGCCGTTPEHIRCLRQAVEGKRVIP